MIIAAVFSGNNLPTATRARSGVMVMQRSWPLAKANGFILKWVLF
jgi:hypothetical protein